ncbi:adenosine kinase [Magnetospirillum molischianum]|uniref:Putative pfkB family carbohydrate kinase putative Adenosine kinase n=1 Tax=Magnetospirillum molischianum DSM 120 TaxID=1150626 RepID=H8FTG7_MAGML|nr:adenosine kinase [Magnetospirillum molischianum]CCG41655.1 putative pfkB family carbohydrate kinase; putative Adenosine kinase [Magnetospirillum molischianum DSM 120]
MAESHTHVAGIGNAIVDVLVQVEDSLLTDLGLTKGIMTLIDDVQAEAIYARLPSGIECSGGSAANTIAGVAALGGSAAYIGKVRNDQLGQVFRHDIRSAGIVFNTEDATTGPATARCFVLVTPDAQRTMLTYLGACVDLGPDDVDAAVIAGAAVTYLEGYLYDPPEAKRAFLRAAEIAHGAGRLVSLSLSDPFCVDRHREAFLDLIANHVDILFANEAELCALYRTDSFDDAVRQVRGHAQIAAVTRGPRGSVVVTADSTYVVAADPVETVVDTTGAGDLYAAGFLYGFTQALDLPTCALLGGIAAGEVISHVGARPVLPLADLARSRLGAGYLEERRK